MGESKSRLVADKRIFRENIGGDFVVHNWEKEDNPVFEKECAWEGIGPNGVNVFKKEDDYLMYYGTCAVEGINRNNYPVGIAWSHDGLNWKRHPKSLDEDGFEYQALERGYFPNNPTGFDHLGIAIYRATEVLPFRVDFYRSENGLDWEAFEKDETTWWCGPSDVIDFFYDYAREKFCMYHKIWKVEGVRLDGEKYAGYFPAFRPHFDRKVGTVRIAGRELFTDNGDVKVTLECTGEGHEDGGGGTVTETMRMLRVIAVAESDDFLTWRNQGVVLEPAFDNISGQFYSTPVLPYPGAHVCFPRYLAGDTGEMHVLFGLSHPDEFDLISKEPVLSCGKAGAWDSGIILSSVPVEIDNKLCMYYSGRRTTHTASNTSEIVSALGRAWLRKDGFVSFTGGTLITKPFTPDGGRLRLNATGEVHAKLFDRAGEQIVSGRFAGDSTDEEVLRTNASKSDPYYLEFNCKNGELFSFWFE